jgi:hypothetical protein
MGQYRGKAIISFDKGTEGTNSKNIFTGEYFGVLICGLPGDRPSYHKPPPSSCNA